MVFYEELETNQLRAMRVKLATLRSKGNIDRVQFDTKQVVNSVLV